ncbi:MAG: 50S ribosomal protein L10 [Berkelbacteria bacterium GW2011_GWA2_46_7]|uniref:Large ribosomal subunit protein uL10 n=1 Tax=Berkelbacteria bacterium GW2011_GWA2_46_7 TaxID=1618335 RepID=A0A0G1QF58_9BACT|nr:MAG: 50S ribosomal protein L10 [Berkelbacteria bacterium GW2011_GWA2_46_7]
MPILRAQKEELVTRLISVLQDSRVSIIFAYKALNMKANDTLRTNAFNAGAKVKMVSNNLLKLILKGIGREMEIPSKQLAISYGFTDEVEAAKVLVEFAKETETLEVLGGWVDGNFFDASQVKTLATLPNKETLQAQLVGRLGGLIGSLAYSLNYPIQKFAFVIEAVKSAQPATAEAPKADLSAVATSEEGEATVETVENATPTDEQQTEKTQTEELEADSPDEVKEPDTVEEEAEVV